MQHLAKTMLQLQSPIL
ncbi:unnamed protein product, partial [Rotaria magnacalcarata]